MNRDYSEVLKGGRARNRNREQMRGDGGGNEGGSGGGQQQRFDQTQTRQALANTLGNAAEAAKSAGISPKLAHRIITEAFG